MHSQSYPLSFPQQAIYLDALLHDPTTKYNMGGGIAIRGPLDAALFRRAVEFAASHHDVQRMRLGIDGDQVVQEFVPEIECKFEVVDLSGRTAPFQAAIDWMLADEAKPTRPDQFPLSSDVLFQLAPDLQLWYPKFHHIANDAYGHALIAETIAAAYNELLAKGHPPELERLSYADFVADDRAYAASARFTDDEAFWRKKFAAMPEPLPFTARKGSLKGDRLRTERCTLGLHRLVYNAVLALCDEAGVTPFQFLLAVMFAYLNRSTGRDDIVIGTPILNRSNHAFRRTAGMFMNMMPLRLPIPQGATILDLARGIRAEVRACYRHQRFPIGETLRHCRTLDGFCHGVYDVTLVYRKLDYDIQFGGSPARTVTLDTNAREETLSLEVDEYNKDEDVNLFFNYNPQLISAEQASQMAKAFEAMLIDVAVVGDRPIGELRLIEEPERRSMRKRSSANGQTVLDHFAQQATAAPDQIAVSDGETRMSYGELAAASSRLADYLTGECGVSIEQPVAVLCDRSAEWIVAMLAVMKAGGAYLPLDADAPRDRIEFILKDSGCQLLLTDSSRGTVEFDGYRTVAIDAATRAEARTPAIARAGARSLAYIIYTSGTTGQPKGVLVEHMGLNNTAMAQAHGWKVGPQDGVLQFSAPMFDASLAEVWVALVSGARLVIAAKADILEPPRFLELLGRERVTIAILPPAYLSALSRAELGSLRLLGTAGEAANPADVAHYSRTLTYVNAYGPTESSICATYWKIERGANFHSDRVPIGKPIPHNGVYILDEQLRRTGVGVAGEICIAGVNVARGYLNRPELTAERFVPSPFRDGERLYRTGDLGRLLADGNIEYLGRSDAQVKIRGYRVELGEIETLLKSHAGVESAVAAATGDGDLAAYVVPRDEFNPGELRRFLSTKLPAYMVPSRWVRMTALPLNSSGKVDRGALPPAREERETGCAVDTPLSPTESSVAEIWQDVLGCGAVAASSEFFELGGHSLSAVAILARIQRHLGVRVQMKEFFSEPTVAHLAAVIESRRRTQEESIQPAPEQDVYPLSRAQARIWVHSRMDGGNAAYNMPLALELSGDLNVSAFEQALAGVIARHEALRTCFVTVNGAPRQKIVPVREIEFQLQQDDLTASPVPEQEANNELRRESAAPFDLSRAPLLRARLLRLAEQRWLLTLVVHHIVGDGWSLEVLLKDLAALYEKALGAPSPELAPLALQYKDYSHWMSQRLEKGAFNEDREYWMGKLAAPIPALNLPADHPRAAQLGFAGSLGRFALPSASASAVRSFCAERGVSPFMVLLASVFGLLHRYTGEQDLIVGTPVAGRERLDLENQVGLYLNTLALRVHVEAGATLAQLVENVRETLLEAQQHQAYPFDQLLSDLKLDRRTDRNPLFDVMAVMQTAVDQGFRAGGVEGAEHDIPAEVSVYDLTFHFAQGGAAARVYLEYNTGLFSRPRMERLAAHLDRLLAAIIAAPERSLADVDVMSDVERRMVLDEFGQGPTLVIPDKTVIDMLADVAERYPGRNAVLYNERRLTYGELAAAASRLADGIERTGVGPGDVVALVADRSEWMVAGVAGIMASGAACLPIDPTLPVERIRHLIADSGARILVSDGAVELSLPLPVIAPRGDGVPEPAPLHGRAKLSDAAYITYTSGSTGTPKASVIEHRSVTNLMIALGSALYDELPNPAIELLLTSIGFDVAIKQIFGALTRGNTVLVASDLERRDPRALMDTIVNRRVQLIDVTPAHFAVLLAQGFARLRKPDLRSVVLGSEALPAGLVTAFVGEQVNRHITLYNFYGPSECTVETLYCRLRPAELGETGVAPIGRPLANTRVYVLSPELCPVPAGVAGEICLGGAPVGRGYLNRPELDAARFVEDPFHPGERIYRTGDLGRWTARGDVEFLGREDGQLKVRGYRIEPAEVEHCLLQHPLVTAAVAAGRSSPAGSTELVAWYTAVDPAPSAVALRDHLRGFLPGYMVPARMVAVPEIPLFANGKVNKDALPDPWSIPAVAPADLQPQDELETEILDMWRRVLGTDGVALDAGFFDVGGSSLLVAGLHTLIDERYPGKLKLIELFTASTIREQASLIRERISAAPRVAETAGTAPAASPESNSRHIAIIGVGVRAGSRQDLDSLWSDLEAGTDFIRPLPAARRSDAEAIARALGINTAAMYETELAYLDEIDKFDFAHFRMAPQKAALLDPREKIFLETAWHAIEDAGYNKTRFKGTRTGVFLGESAGSSDFSRVLEASETGDINQLLESLTPSMAAGRISYLLDLKGPALLVDTACSSGLAAVGLAVDALRTGRCEMALAGAIRLFTLPSDRAARTEIESSDGRTHSFDDAASGTGGGEISIALLLKPLDRALADGDPIHAVVRGVAMNQDGASTGITAPNARAQANVLDEAWRDAAIHPESLAFIEAHGTGTRLGDPIEVEGITRAFRRHSERTQCCALGSIKSNIGHADHAAGLAGLIRAVLCLEHRCVAPVVHFETPNRNIHFEQSPVFVNSQPLALDGRDAPLRCGVSSFGLSGTNVHVVIEQAPTRAAARADGRTFLLPLSARTRALAGSYAARLAHYVEQHLELAEADIAYTFATGREHMGARAAILFNSTRQLIERLKLLSENPAECAGQGVFFGVHKSVPNGKAVLLEHEVTEETVSRLTQEAETREDLTDLARLYVRGAQLPWESLFAGAGAQRRALPGYPFERTRSWPQIRHAGFSLLGDLKAETPETLIFESEWRQDSHWLLGDHRLSGTSVLVGSAYLELAQQVARRMWDTERVEIARLAMLAPLAITQGETLRVVVAVARERENLRMAVHSHSKVQGWQTHATAELARLAPDHQEALDIDALGAECQQEFALDTALPAVAEAGPRWNCLRAARRNDGVFLAELDVPSEHARDAAEFGLYPPLVDVALNFATGGGSHLPLWLGGVRIHSRLPEKPIARVRTLDANAEMPRFEVVIAGRDGKVALAAREYALKSRSVPRRLNGFFHRVAWTATEANPIGAAPSNLLLVAPACECERDRHLVESIGAASIARTEQEWRAWLAARSDDDDVNAILLLPSCRGVNGVSAASLDGELDAVLGGLFTFSQALARRRGAARLLVAGHLAHEVTGNEAALNSLHAAAAGFARVPTLETAAFECRFLDCDAALDGQQIPREFAAAFASRDAIVAWRDGRRYVQRMEPLDLASTPDRPFEVRSGATYLITGGTGGMGLEIARYLAHRARVELLLVNRSVFPPRSAWDALEAEGTDVNLKTRIRTLKEIESLGSVVRVVPGDAASLEDMTRLKREHPGVRGVFHCAGVGNDVFLARHDWARLSGVLRPKLHGTTVLSEVFGGDNLDTFVMAGSLTAFTGAPGQCGYTAANAFQDAEACRLRRAGLPAQCVNWTAWKETGMAAATGKVADDTFRAIATADALLCLDRAVRKDLAHLVVGEEAPVEVVVRADTVAQHAAPSTSGKAVLLGRSDGNYTATERLVGELWAEALGHTELDVFADFEDLGGDSIANIQILERMVSDTPFRPALPDLIKHPTIESLSTFLDREQFVAQRGSADEREHLVRLSKDGPRPLFCFAPGSGSCYRYYDLARRLPGWSVYGLNYIETKDPGAVMADILINTQPEGDFMLLGYSIGGNMAYEVAHELESRGRGVRGLIFLDNWRRLEHFQFTDEEYRKNAEEFLQAVDSRYLALGKREAMIRRVEAYDRYMDSRIEDRNLSCPIRLVRAEVLELKSIFRISQEGWGDLTPDFQMTIGSGRHLEMLDEPHVVKNAALVDAYLNELTPLGDTAEVVK